MSPLVAAALCGSSTVAQRLLRASAAAEAADAQGRTARAAAAATGSGPLPGLRDGWFLMFNVNPG